jgi:hypothetical protein
LQSAAHPMHAHQQHSDLAALQSTAHPMHLQALHESADTASGASQDAALQKRSAAVTAVCAPSPAALWQPAA